jgi:hypothetical protein
LKVFDKEYPDLNYWIWEINNSILNFIEQ